MKTYYIYILTNQKHGVLYIGVTNDLKRRVYEHKNKLNEGFTKKYNTTRLVYMEETNSINDALQREKQLKKWNRAWKIKLIDEYNPEWLDLYDDLP